MNCGSTWLPFLFLVLVFLGLKGLCTNNILELCSQVNPKLAHTAITEYSRWSDKQNIFIILEVHDRSIRKFVWFSSGPLLGLHSCCLLSVCMYLCLHFVSKFPLLIRIYGVQGPSWQTYLISVTMTSLQIHLHSLVLGIGGFNFQNFKDIFQPITTNWIWIFLQKQVILVRPRYRNAKTNS